MDPSTWHIILIITVVLLIILSAIITLAETAYLNISKSKIKHLLENEVPKSLELSKLSEREEEVYHGLVVSNTFVNVATASIGAFLLFHVLTFHEITELVISIFSMVFLIVILGEIIPETLARRNPEKYALKYVGLTNILLIIFRPIGVIFYGISRTILRLLGYKKIKEEPTITKEELKSIVDASVEEGVLKVEEKELIDNVTEFSILRVEDVMTQRFDMVTLDVEESYDEVLELLKEEKYSRVPVYKDSTDNIIGILNIKDFLLVDKENFNLKDYIREPYFTYEFKLVTDLFKEMRKERTHMAIVLDEYGGTVGLVTIEDFIEEIVGEIDDEYDDEPELEIIKLSNNTYEVDASLKLEDFNNECDQNIQSDDVDSIGGFVIDNFGRFPEVNEVLEYENLIIKVTEVEKNRVTKLNVTINDEDK